MKHAIGTFPVPALPSLPIRILLLSSALILIARLPLTLAQSSGGRPTTRVLAADSLAAPWFNASWGGAFDLTNTEQVWAGATAIKATLAEGGGLRLRSGDWNHPVGQDLSPYDTLSLRLRLDSPGPLRVGLSGDDPAVSFPAVALDSLPAGQWVRVALSMAELGGTGTSADYVRIVNAGTASLTFWVDEWALSGDGGPAVRGIAWDGLAAPWIPSCWTGAFDFTNSERVYSGSSSIKAAMGGWGGLRVHAGPWDYPQHPEISPYDSLRFAVWPDSAGAVLVGLSSEAGGHFPTVVLDSLSVGQWNQVALALDRLSPGGDRPDQVRIVNYIAAPRTLWVDNWELSRPDGDTTAARYPVITVSHPPNGYQTDSSAVHIAGTVADTTESVTLTINEQPVTLGSGGEFNHKAHLFPGDNYFMLEATGANGNRARLSRKVTRTYITAIPPDPATVAPPVDSTVVTTLGASTEFLYQGANPVQYGVEEGTIGARRAAVVKGHVRGRSGSPLDSVMITILEHPEYGYTFTRSDGAFDLAVNGGGTLTLRYQNDAYLPAQRQVAVPWQDYAVADSVVMVPLDPAVTTIDFSDPVEVARGSVESDTDGSRQATLLFARGTVATMALPDGSTQELASLDVRATEYTVGPGGHAGPAATHEWIHLCRGV